METMVILKLILAGVLLTLIAITFISYRLFYRKSQPKLAGESNSGGSCGCGGCGCGGGDGK